MEGERETYIDDNMFEFRTLFKEFSDVKKSAKRWSFKENLEFS